jgi:hypothetical protein
VASAAVAKDQPMSSEPARGHVDNFSAAGWV